MASKLKIAKSTFLRYPGGRIFRRNRSGSHSEGYRSKFVFFHFWQKFKMAAILGRENFLKIAKSTLLRYSVGLSRTVKEIIKFVFFHF